MDKEEKKIVIKPQNKFLLIDFKEIIHYRELLYFFTWRDIKVKYKQTFLGVSWAIIQPFFTMVVFSVFFGKLGKIPSDNIPYPIFSFSALVPWTFFANSLLFASNSLVSSSHMITKVYFPRIILPISSILSTFIDFLISFLVLIGMMFFYRIFPTRNIIFLPLFLLLIAITSAGFGFFLSAINVKYRDVKYAIPFLIQFWLFITPIAYPSSLLREPLKTLYGINPMAGVIEGFRWALIGTKNPGKIIFLSAIISITIFFLGLLYFKRVEREFADII